MIGNKYRQHTSSSLLRKYEKGFSMVELLTSVGLFMVVVVASTSLFLAIVQGNRKAVAIQNILDEGRFVLEIISRDVRTGIEFAPNALPGPQEQNPFEFTNADGNIVCYRFNIADPANKKIEKVISAVPGCGGVVTQVTSSHIQVDHLRFLVNGTIPGDNMQPRITILMGISNKGSRAESVSTINLQNTVSPRVLDLP